MKESDVFSMFTEITGKPLTESGNNPLENLMQEFKRALSVEMSNFVVKCMAESVPKFAEQYGTPHYEELREKMRDVCERYRIMSSDERLDLFKKIEITFKDVFVPFTQSVGAAADDIATSYATQCVEIIKVSNDLAAQSSTVPKINFAKV